jgi:hypothetical protein
VGKTLVLCGTATLVLCGTQHPLWLPFHLIDWFGLWLGFRLSFGDSLGQGCEATNLGRVVCVAALDLIPFNELIFGLGFFESTHLVIRLLKLMNLMCRLLSVVKI